MNLPLKHAVIYGVAGTELTPEERLFFSKHRPFGFILFARNCQEPEQVKRLVADLNTIVGEDFVPILIDQEGGRVARLKPPHWRAYPAAGYFALLAQTDIRAAEEAVYLNARLIGRELNLLGITVNCAPMADLLFPEAHHIVGDRAFGSSPEQVIRLCHAMANGLMDEGIIPILKHLPGHGRALADSHESLPIVTTPLDELQATDFKVFKGLSDIPFGMTAHIIYTAIDARNPATLSPDVIGLIREDMGFDGLLMTDDLSMKALSGDLGDLGAESIYAGCDIILHCNGNMMEMQMIADKAPLVSKNCARRYNAAKHALAMRISPPPETADSIQLRLEKLMA